MDLTEYLEHHAYGEGIRVEYELQSVVSHQGVLETGHYVAHVKVGNKWQQVDDLGGTPAKVVRASSIEDINKDKPKTFTPFLMAWAKVEEEIFDPPPTEDAKIEDPEDGTGKDDKTGKDYEPGKGGKLGKGGKRGKRPKRDGSSSSSSSPDSDNGVPAAKKGTVDVKLTLYIDNDEKPQIVRTVLNCPADGKKGFPFSGATRFTDDQSITISNTLANAAGREIRTAREAALKPAAMPKNADTPPTKTGPKTQEPKKPGPKKADTKKAETKKAETREGRNQGGRN